MNQVFWVQYQTNEPVKIETQYAGEQKRRNSLSVVADMIGAAAIGATRRLLGLPKQFGPLTLHAVADGVESNLPGNQLLSLIPTASCSFDNPLIIKSKSDMDVGGSLGRRSPSDEFIADQKLNLQKSQDILAFLRHQIEVLAPYNPQHPYQATFASNCLEHRLDRRQTKYQLDNVDNVKILLLVSGAGKTRQLLEMLWMKCGYYFLLYFVRAFVCNYIYDLGYNQPSQILLAQLHPTQFFGRDIFEDLFDSLAKRSQTTTIAIKIESCFDFVAIDEIQMTVESNAVFRLTSQKQRPFYSPLVYHTKRLGKFTNFIVSGTGINYQLIEELMASSTMKASGFTRHSVISGIEPLDKDAIAAYSRLILSEHNFNESDTEKFVDLVSSFKLCHGRARFIAFILDSFVKNNDTEIAINEFVSGLTNVNGDLFPLKFFRRDLKNKLTSFSKVVGGDTLGRLLREGILEYMMSGKAKLTVEGQMASDAVRYGLGYCIITEGSIFAVELVEDAIIECLRYLVPFSDVAKTLVLRLQTCPMPQMVGFMLEYLVAYAFVANLHPGSKHKIKTFAGSMVQYLQSNSAQYQVFFPDHCCGPDILFKDRNTLYIIQVKFVDTIAKQERVDACNTTDPQYFYRNRKTESVLRGRETRRNEILPALQNLHHKRLVFLHTTTSTTDGTDGVTVITQKTHPYFFDEVGYGIWAVLNRMRREFNANKRR
ncbi:hypothetical protein CcCBS67573_g10145 [Chytriomyces confervae]|uniref:Uncharacterized protein n=1 Tax=Chytriomyces confervae TaxID=246404 RepID=A0A507DE63_9FUNG|nr:hypothetical protein CcCBS67573_g10145 [Chytriomyces confervae]